jgi:hypothetical protein
MLDWRKLMDTKAIILVNFSMGQNKDAILEFFGTMFTTFISDATFSRDDTPRDDRVPHIFFLDEFERFVHQDGDMKKFLEMARSYALGLALAHQNVAQITNPALMGTIKDNTFSQISLLIGADSAPSVAKMFENGVQAEDLTSMENTETYKTGFARFKTINPAPFTFVSPSMATYFKSVSWEDVNKWKEQYKKRNYRHIDEVKGDIDQRWTLVEKNRVDDDGSPQVKKGDATGRLKRRGKDDEKVAQ